MILNYCYVKLITETLYENFTIINFNNLRIDLYLNTGSFNGREDHK